MKNRLDLGLGIPLASHEDFDVSFPKKELSVEDIDDLRKPSLCKFGHLG
jgi:hypothetical protein